MHGSGRSPGGAASPLLSLPLTTCSTYSSAAARCGTADRVIGHTGAGVLAVDQGRGAGLPRGTRMIALASEPVPTRVSLVASRRARCHRRRDRRHRVVLFHRPVVPVCCAIVVVSVAGPVFDLPPRGHADERWRSHALPGRRCRTRSVAPRRRRGRHGGRGVPESAGETGPVSGRTLGLHGSVPQGLATDSPAPALRGTGHRAAFAQSIAPGSGDDFAQMRALGFDVVRLVLNWSQLEPTPGTYSATYLARVSQVVGWARQQGIYVILDMHQDQYSRYILPASAKSAPSGCTPSGGSDGAPSWAVQTDGKQGCALYGIDELNPAESAAFANFWQNSPVAAPRDNRPGRDCRTTTSARSPCSHIASRKPRRVGLRVDERAAARVDRIAPGGQRVPGQQFRALSVLHPSDRGFDRGAGRASTCPASDPTSLTGACAYPQLASVSHQQIFFEPLAYRNLVDFSLQVEHAVHVVPEHCVRAARLHLRLHRRAGAAGIAGERRRLPPELHVRLPDGRSRSAVDALGRAGHGVRGLSEHGQRHFVQGASSAGSDTNRGHHLGLEGSLQGSGHVLVHPMAALDVPNDIERDPGKGNPKATPRPMTA